MGSSPPVTSIVCADTVICADTTRGMPLPEVG